MELKSSLSWSECFSLFCHCVYEWIEEAVEVCMHAFVHVRSHIPPSMRASVLCVCMCVPALHGDISTSCSQAVKPLGRYCVQPRCPPALRETLQGLSLTRAAQAGHSSVRYALCEPLLSLLQLRAQGHHSSEHCHSPHRPLKHTGRDSRGMNCAH